MDPLKNFKTNPRHNLEKMDGEIKPQEERLEYFLEEF